MAKSFADRPKWQRLAIIGGWVLIALVMISVVFGPDRPAPARPANQAGLESAPEVFEMPQPDFFALVIPAGAKPEAFEGLAKEQCGDRSFCKVFGWIDRARAARAMPMSEREVAAIAFSYSLNRANDSEQLVFDCGRFPQPDPINCIGG